MTTSCIIVKSKILKEDTISILDNKQIICLNQIITSKSCSPKSTLCEDRSNLEVWCVFKPGVSVNLFHFFITFNPSIMSQCCDFPPPQFEENGKMWSKWKHSFSLYIHPYSKFGKIFEQLAIRMHKLIDKQIFCRGKQQCKGNAWGLASIYICMCLL